VLIQIGARSMTRSGHWRPASRTGGKGRYLVGVGAVMREAPEDSFDDEILRKTAQQVLAFRACLPAMIGRIFLLIDNLRNKMDLDRYDRQILAVLQQDGRISNQDLADRIGLSPSPCLRRVRALEEAGLIAGYRALLDAKKLGLSLMALIGISMDQHTPERFANLEAAIADIPEVLECLLITGQQSDYQLKVVVRDMDAYQDLLLNKITRIQGVTGVHTSFVLRKVVDRTSLPVQARQ
jgi:Lrp/AsnC family leucine-responsive transcriptional regulator